MKKRSIRILKKGVTQEKLVELAKFNGAPIKSDYYGIVGEIIINK